MSEWRLEKEVVARQEDSVTSKRRYSFYATTAILHERAYPLEVVIGHSC